MSRDRFGVDWHGRRVVVVGLAKSGAAASKLLQQAGCRVRVTERCDTSSVRTAAEELKAAGVEAVEIGQHSRQFLDGCEAVVVSPGVPESAEPIQWALASGRPVWSEIELAFRFCPASVVAVTGTNGKSSVCTLIQHVLQAAGRPAVACGNLGTPFSEVVSSLTTQMTAVVEVSSFQLLWCDQFRPTIGILLNVGTNHLDRHQDRSHYINAKARLFQRQTPTDVAVLNGCDPEVVTLSQRVVAQRVWFGDNRTNPPRFRLGPSSCRVLSESGQAVLQVGRVLGIPDPLVYQVIREFQGLEHRLEYVTTVQGIRFVNDAKSTTPESLLYALQRCQGPVVPIVGGRDKGLDFTPLKAALAQDRIRGVMLIGESRKQIRTLLNGSTTSRECETLAEAVEEAAKLARPGDTVLFSPACASFDMFRNFEERGRLYKQLVRALPNDSSPNGHHQAPSA